MTRASCLSRGIRAAAAAAFTAFLVAGLPGAAHADPATTTDRPQTSDQATAQIHKLTQQASETAEQYNVATIKLTKYRKQVAKAQATLKKINGQIVDLDGQVKTIAASAYKNGHLSSFSAFMTSGSPQNFLDQLSALDVIASKQSSVLTALDQAKVNAERSRKQAQQAAADAKRTATELGTKKASIQKRIAQLQALKSQLSAQERAALEAQEGSTDPHVVAQQAAEAMHTDAAEPATSTQTLPPSDSGGESSAAAIAVAAAKAQIGKPYAWGAAGPDSFDCSGLMLYAWAKAGVSLPHSSAMQAALPHQVSESELQPGDLVGYYSPVHHVAMYVGNGMVIHAPDFGETVKYAPVNSMPFASASRPG